MHHMHMLQDHLNMLDTIYFYIYKYIYKYGAEWHVCGCEYIVVCANSLIVYNTKEMYVCINPYIDIYIYCNHSLHLECCYYMGGLGRKNDIYAILTSHKNEWA